MNIYKVSRTDEIDDNEYDEMVVVAESESAARLLTPSTSEDPELWTNKLETLEVELIGTSIDGAVAGRIVTKSFIVER